MPSVATKRWSGAGILDSFRGTVVHDHWKPYFTYDECAHALCNAHHLRELRYVATQYHQGLANDMAALLVEIKAAVAATPAPAMCLALPELLAFETRYDALVQAGFEANPRAVATTEGAPKTRSSETITPGEPADSSAGLQKTGIGIHGGLSRAV